MTDQTTEAKIDAALANLTYYRPLEPPAGTRWILYECAYDAADADEDDDDAPKCGYQYVAPVEDKAYGLDVPAGPIDHCPSCGGYLSFVGQDKIGVTSGPWKREGKAWEPPVDS